MNAFTLVTAKHCLRAEDQTRSVQMIFNLESRACSLSYSSERTPIGLDTRQAGFIDGADVGYMPVPEGADVAGAATDVAERLPPAGSNIYFVGYPGGVGPQRVGCRLDGPTAYFMANGHKVYLSYRMTCPYLGRPGGASGGPVFNDREEMIGVVTSGPLRKRDRSILAFEPFVRDIIGRGPIAKITPRFPQPVLDEAGVDIETGETIAISARTNPLSMVTHLVIKYLREPRVIEVDERDNLVIK